MILLSRKDHTYSGRSIPTELSKLNTQALLIGHESSRRMPIGRNSLPAGGGSPSTLLGEFEALWKS